MITLSSVCMQEELEIPPRCEVVVDGTTDFHNTLSTNVAVFEPVEVKVHGILVARNICEPSKGLIPVKIFHTIGWHEECAASVIIVIIVDIGGNNIHIFSMQ